MSKISELSDGGSLVSSDYLIAVRSGGNVKVRMDQINVDQVDLGDNEFIRLGNSQDLTMVHTSTQSIINQAGIGDLLLQKAGATKLTINATGIDVTGSVTADGLTVDGNAGIGTSSPNNFSTAGATNVLGVKGTSGGLVSISATGTNFSGIDMGSGTIRRSGIYSLDGSNMGFYTNPTNAGGALTERMRIDASGNVGINTTPKAWTAFTPVLQIKNASTGGGGALAGTSADNFRMFANTYYDGSYKRLATGFATQYGQESGNHVWSTAATGAGESAITWAESMRIDASGFVGIGASSPSSYPVAPELVVDTGVSGGITVVSDSTTGGYGGVFFADGTTGNEQYRGFIQYNHNNGGSVDSLILGTSGTERMRIDAGGDVGIGTTGSVAFSDGSGLRIERAATATIRLQDTGAHGFEIRATASAAEFFSANSKPFTFDTGGSERMRIDASGNLLVGQQTASSNAVGTSLRSDGRNFYCADGNYSAHFNRKTSDGAIVHFAKDDTIVGSIGVKDGDLVIHSTAAGHEGLRLGNGAIVATDNAGATTDASCNLGGATSRFTNLYLSGGTIVAGRTTFGTAGFWDASGTGNDKGVRAGGAGLYPTDGSGTAADATMDIGTAAARFKDLYLSGGVYLGGTGAANKLEDYEEGTWTPTVTSGVTSPVYTNQSGSYTKIGNLVYFQFRVDLSSGTAAVSQFKFGNLPFTSANVANYGGAWISYSQGFLDDLGTASWHIGPNNTEVFAYEPDGSIMTGIELEAIGNVLGNVYLNGVYRVA